jgi:hypothetical protein
MLLLEGSRALIIVALRDSSDFQLSDVDIRRVDPPGRLSVAMTKPATTVSVFVTPYRVARSHALLTSPSSMTTAEYVPLALLHEIKTKVNWSSRWRYSAATEGLLSTWNRSGKMAIKASLSSCRLEE